MKNVFRNERQPNGRPSAQDTVSPIHGLEMDNVQRPRPRKGEVQGEAEAYTVEKVRRILDGLENEPLKWRVFLRLLIDTGIRSGECCALKRKDIEDFHPHKLRCQRR